MVILNGTIEQVHDQLVELNPNWDSEYLTEVVDDFEKPQDGKEVEKRTDFFGAKTICGRNGWRAAKGATIREGIGYLRGVNGKPSMGPGPGNCGRVSCSYDSGIFWCNDVSLAHSFPYSQAALWKLTCRFKSLQSGSTKTLSSYGSIADGAQHVLNECGNRPAGSSLVLVVGQVFHKTDWNVIVRETGC